ncbi:MAG: polysaccharide deacetylase family protein, partial [Actinomycetota bacterium]
AYLAPGLAAAPIGRRAFRTVRHLDGAPGPGKVNGGVTPATSNGGTSPGGGKVALTFDDGPEPKAVEAFLEALAELKVTATFFLVGEQVRRAPEAARKLVAAGHEVACHGYRHKNHLRLPPRTTIRDLTDARDVIVSETGAEIRHFRPPYGVFNLASWLTADRFGWNRVLWARWARDWEPDATPELIRSRLLSGVVDRDVLLLHDAEAYSSAGSWRRTLGALEPIVTELRAKGLEPGPLGDIPASVAGAHRAPR